MNSAMPRTSPPSPRRRIVRTGALVVRDMKLRAARAQTKDPEPGEGHAEGGAYYLVAGGGVIAVAGCYIDAMDEAEDLLPEGTFFDILFLGDEIELRADLSNASFRRRSPCGRPGHRRP